MKKERVIQIASGRLIAMYSRIKTVRVPIRFHFSA